MDVTGGNDDTVQKKKHALADWIKTEQEKVPRHSLHGVILAPVAETCKDGDNVRVVCGERAQIEPGGFRQVFQWFTSM